MPLYNLTYYQQQINELLQNPPATSSLYPIATINDAINKARLWIAGEAQCILQLGQLTIPSSTNSQPFSAIAITNAIANGIQGVLNVKTASYSVGPLTTPPFPGLRFIHPRSWEWFTIYELNRGTFYPDAQSNPYPRSWSQLGQGVSGTFYAMPFCNQDNQFILTVACYPIDLNLPTDFEAIPAPWTQCVPFLAAYYALLSAQSGNRRADADKMFSDYSKFMDRARGMVTPATTQNIWPQQSDPTDVNKLGLQKQGQ